MNKEIVRELFAPLALLIDKENRKEVLNDVEAIKAILFDFRAPIFALLGNEERSRESILSTFIHKDYLLGEDQLEDEECIEESSIKGWYKYSSQIIVSDFRVKDRDFDDAPHPDSLLVLFRKGDPIDDIVQQSITLREETEDAVDRNIGTIFLIDEKRGSKSFYEVKKKIIAALTHRSLGANWAPLFSLQHTRKISEALLDTLPPQTTITMARLFLNEKAKRKMSERIIQLSTATSAAIAGVPLPIADLIPISTIQTLMIAAIAYISGRTFSTRLLAEFLASLGLNVGVGLAMRELVRALSQLIPLAGPFVSASIASGATTTLGKSATRHFLS